MAKYAYSFSHAIVTVESRQFVGVRSVTINQSLTEAPVYGTDMRPIGRSVGQLGLGTGQLVFSDYNEGMDFYAHLGTQPLLKLWALDYTQTREDGSFRGIECVECRLTGFGVEHEAGPDALAVTYPFSFREMKVDGLDLAITPKKLARAAIGIAENLANLL